MLRTLLSELRRRGVLKTCVAYLVVGFGVLQGADLALPRLGVGEGVMTALVVGVVAGFPLVALLSWFYDLDLSGLVRVPESDGAGVGAQERVVVLASGIVVLAVLAGAGWAFLARRGADSGSSEAAALADDRVAISPFRVTGDPDLEYLGEGMLDLLAAKLTGEGGLRAVEPRAVLSRWRAMEGESQEDARSMARTLGAGRVLLGSVVGTSSSSIQIAGRILDTLTGDLIASHELSGRTDDLAALVDRFAAGLLSQMTEVDPDRLRALERTPLPALRAYLEGHRLLRDGRFEDAKAQFGLAQRIDSTFALPGIFHTIAGSFTSRWSSEGAELAWRHRASLSPRDQLLLQGVLANSGSWPELEAILERVVEDSQDRVEAWYLLGDAVYHSDPATPLPDRLVRASGLFRAATDLDDRFAPAEMHLFEIALLQGDLETARTLARSVAAHARDGDLAAYVGWFLDHLEGRPGWMPAVDDPFVTMRLWAATMSVPFTVGLEASDSVVEWGARTASEADRFILDETPRYMWNRGQPGRAREIVRRRRLDSTFDAEATLLYTALFWEAAAPGDSLEAAARALVRRALESRRSGDPWMPAACVAGLYLASRGRVEDAPSLEPDPGVAADPTSTVQRDARACRAAQGILADLRRADLFAPVEPLDIPPPIALATHLAELDGLLADGLITGLWLRDAAPLLLAWGYERTGEPERALEAVRRHRVAMPGINFTSSYLREEGRLAARAGRADEARRAWARYLAMRAGAEPEVLSAVQEVRARFEALGPG